MFTGIIKKICSVTALISRDKFLSFEIEIGESLMSGLLCGASVAIDGVCLTVVKLEGSKVWFDAIEETLLCTSLKSLKKHDCVNVERAACFGDEIGGHFLSGHIYGTAKIEEIEHFVHHSILTLSCPKEWTNYLFPKGFVALNGASLTLVEVTISPDTNRGRFTVHLIPETLRNTTFRKKSKGDLINIELDAHTQAVVDTVERVLKSKYLAAGG